MAEGTGACNFLCSCVCAYLLPPLGVYWRFGCGMEFLICLVLTLLGYVPGVVYAVCIIGLEDTDASEKKPLQPPELPTPQGSP